MAADTEDLVLSISADVRQMQRALARLTGDTAKTTTAIQKHFDGLGDIGGAAFDKIAANSNKAGNAVRDNARKISQAMNTSRLQTANLAAQINDIGVQLAGGQSPFLIAIQQGSQINQVLGQQGARGAVGALAGAFTSLLNPVSLATIAIIGLGGAAVQYFTEMLSKGDMTAEQLKEQADLIDRVAKKWGDAVPALKEYADQLDRLKEEADLRAATQLRIEDIFKGAREQLKELKLDMVELVNVLRTAGTSGDDIARVERAFKALNEAINSNKDSSKENKELLSALSTVYINSGVPAADAFAKKVYGIADAFAEVAKRAAEAAEQERKALEQARLADFGKTLPGNLGMVPPVYSGGGRFLNPQEFMDFSASESRFREAGESAAAAMIRGFENFSDRAYSDKRTSTGEHDAWRVGFGSDTTTRANGMIERVTKDTVVSLDDAERDLSRRILEFQTGIQSAIGVDTWRSLNEAQKAALTSIAYNYGQLPRSIVKAIEGGGGPQVVANAIAALSANPARRKEEAQAFLSGSGFSLSEAGIGRRSPSDIFKGSMQDVERRIAALNAEFEAQARLNPLVNDYGFAVEKARIQQDLLNKAQEAGVTVTPELAAQIDTLATNMAKASAGSVQLRESQEQLARQAADFRDIGREAVGGLIRDLVAGKDASEALANALARVGDRLLDMALNNLFSGGPGGLFGGRGGLLGGVLIPGILHKGGIAGRDGYGHGRAVSPSVFSGAKRMHSGGIAGLRPDEVPAILQRGERVIPKGARGVSETINVVLRDDSGRMADIADQRIRTRAGTIVNVAVEQSTKVIRKQMPGLMSEAQARSL